MRYLLDTHTFFWFVGGSNELSKSAKALIENIDNEIVVSAVCLWELAIKISQGKLTLGQPFEAYFVHHITTNKMEYLSISIRHTATVMNMPFHHKDPFDRLLIAQAMAEGIPIISRDAMFDAYPIQRVW